jgi:hypothetical protein
MICLGLIVAVVFLSMTAAWSANTAFMTDSEVRRAIILDSIKAYTGECPCPYSRTDDGFRCGDKSKAKQGERPKPVCYPEDVTNEMVERYRAATT